MLEGKGIPDTEGQRGKYWDNCNSIINKIYKKKDKENPTSISKKRRKKQGQGLWIDTCPKRTYRWPTDILNILDIMRELQTETTVRQHLTPVTRKPL